MLTFALGALGLAVDAAASGTSTGALTALGAAAACLGDVGPEFGEAGPFGSYAPFGDVSTGILTALMLLGRIEILPLVVLVSRTYWRA